MNWIDINVHVCSPDIPLSPVDCTMYTIGTETLFYSLISFGEIQHLGILLQL